eukprot:TRINITY_DN12182_c0_g1_i1.p1 TRINITY_DN12182_c0_g1~~TRINITY_DN12182_c0_g1_i1.p1  ORF type:complete len:326 (-),score=5.59 TRINITY_DN12182_c0_g1_i1:69-1007(-)
MDTSSKKLAILFISLSITLTTLTIYPTIKNIPSSIFFYYHPILMALAFYVCFPMGLLLLMAKVPGYSRKDKIVAHTYLQVVGSVACVAGGLAVYLNKEAGTTNKMDTSSKKLAILFISLSITLTTLTIYPTIKNIPSSIFFYYHPILMALAFYVCFPMGLLLLMAKVPGYSRKDKIVAHTYLQVVGSVACVAGGLAVYLNKEAFSKPHFTSFHGLFGLFVVVAVVLQLAYGLALRFKWPKIVIKNEWYNARILHKRAANIVLITALVVTFFALSSNFVVTNVQFGVRIFWGILIIVLALWCSTIALRFVRLK